MLRLGRHGNKVLERLEILDSAFAAAIDARARRVDRSGTRQRRQRDSVIGWSVAATLSLLAVAYFGVPAIAERLAPLVPAPIAHKLGDAVDMQVRGMLDNHHLGAGFECGMTAGEKPGRAALDQTGAPAGGRRRAAVPVARDRGAPERGQRHGAAGRADLRVPGPDRQGRQCRRGGRRDRA